MWPSILDQSLMIFHYYRRRQIRFKCLFLGGPMMKDKEKEKEL